MKYIIDEVPLDYEVAGLKRPEKKSTITLYVPDRIAEKPEPRPAVVLCPGGGYTFVSPREAEPVALRYCAADIPVLVLDYAVAPSRFPAALLELAASVRYLRLHAVEFGVDPARIAVSGFSAGGHLAAGLCVYWNRDFIARALNCPSGEYKPNAAILCYPVISGRGEVRHTGSLENLYGQGFSPADEAAFSLEKEAGPHCPPAFLWHTAPDDLVPVENSLLFASALAKHKVPFELHVYPSGGHGLSLAVPQVDMPAVPETASLRDWPNLAIEWLKGNAFKACSCSPGV
jgi:acetyl esterase/lipase